MAENLQEKSEKFRCRLCRFTLFETEDISKTHVLSEKCNSWFLRDDEGMLPWVQKLIDEAGWTEGKLYCPKCNGRVGGFDFLHVVPCSCSVDVIPAIWCPRSKIDHVKKILQNEEFKKVSHETKGDEEDKVSNSRPDNNLSGSSKCIASNNCEHARNGTKEGNTQSHAMSSQSHTCSTQTCCHTHFCCHSMAPCSDRFKVIKCTDDLHPCKAHHCIESLNQGTRFQSAHHDATSQNLGAVAVDYGPDMQQTFANIHQELQEMRQEVIHLTARRDENISRETLPPIEPDDIVNSPSEIKTKRKRKNKPRRRCRGNWDNEPFFLENSRRRFNFVPEEYSEINSSSSQQHTTDVLELSDSEIPDCYKCAVCLSLLFEPYKTPCGHIFCGLCLRHLNFATSGRPKCPLCREPVWNVENEKDIELEIKENFPANYRRRAREERKNKHRRSPLPSAFDSYNDNRERSTMMSIIRYISIIAMIISLVINSMIVNANRLDPVQRRNLITKVVYIVITIIACVAMVVIGICLLIFAVDFFKIALFIVVSYVGLSRFILRTLVD